MGEGERVDIIDIVIPFIRLAFVVHSFICSVVLCVVVVVGSLSPHSVGRLLIDVVLNLLQQ